MTTTDLMLSDADNVSGGIVVGRKCHISSRIWRKALHMHRTIHLVAHLMLAWRRNHHLGDF